MSTELCIVCLDEYSININTIPHLIKLCECQFWIHEICINAWLIKEPVCPICKKLMIYETEELKSDAIINNNNIDNNNIDNNNIDNNNIDNNVIDNNIDNNFVPKNYLICIRKTLLFLIIVFIIVIILIFTFV